MGFWSNLFRRMDRAPEVKALGPLDIALDALLGGRTKSGQSVTWEKALQVSTVLSCVKVIAEGIAQVPLKLFRESPDGRTRLPARDHPVYEVLHLRANAWQTSFEWREMSAIHASLCGNAFSYLNRFRGDVSEIVPFTPQNVLVVKDSGVIKRYDVTIDGEVRKFAPADILHIRGVSWDSYSGLDTVRLAREAIGLALATEETHAQFHQNGAKPSGLLSVEGQLTKEQYDQLYAWLAKSIGSQNAGVPLVMDRSAKWVAQAMSGVDAQHVETRLHQVREICSFFRVMPLMVGYTDKASTYASAEQMFLAHVVHTLAPWYERIEQRLNVQVLTEEDRRDGLYAKFIEEGLLRGAMKDTADYLVKLTTNGILTRNEARAKLDENPLGGLDEPLTPVNMTGKSTQEAEGGSAHGDS